MRGMPDWRRYLGGASLFFAESEVSGAQRGGAYKKACIYGTMLL